MQQGASPKIPWGYCQEAGCMLNRAGTGRARVKDGKCGVCKDGSVHCAGHCPGPRTGANRARGFAERRVVPAFRSRSPARGSQQRGESARDVADRQAKETAERLARQNVDTSRSSIEESLVAQWRRHGDNFAARPLPVVGKRHIGVVPGVTWGDGLRSEKTKELLTSEPWLSSKCNDSVHLTLFLRWAEKQLAQEASHRQGVMELGYHIAKRMLAFSRDL